MLKHLLAAAMILAGVIPIFAADDLDEVQSPRIFPLTDVCEDAILIIASYGTAKDCINLASTCHAFHDLLNRNPTIWRGYLSKIPGLTHPKLQGPEDEHPKDKFLRLMKPQFWLLTELDNNYNYTPVSISGNGLWVIGKKDKLSKNYSYPPRCSTESFILNIETGVKEILDSPSVHTVTNEGEVLGGYPTFIWTPKGGKQPLKTLDGYTIFNTIQISRNGRWIRGFYEHDSCKRGVLIWDRETETKKFCERLISYISNNGIIFGIIVDKDGVNYIRSHALGEETELILPNINYLHDLSSTTSNGSLCVGHFHRIEENTDIAAINTQLANGECQLTLLGCLEGDTRSHAMDVSDNRIVVGYSANRGFRGFFWTEETGMLSLNQLLGDRFPKDYNFHSAIKITTDGLFILGSIDFNSHTFVIPNNYIGDERGHIQNSSLYLAYIPDFKAYRAQGIIPPFIKPFLRSN